MILPDSKQSEQDWIVRHGSGFDAYIFARHVPGADIACLQEVVIDRGSAVDLLCFARDVPGADIQAIYAQMTCLSEFGLAESGVLAQFEREFVKASKPRGESDGVQLMLEAIRDSVLSLSAQVTLVGHSCGANQGLAMAATLLRRAAAEIESVAQEEGRRGRSGGSGGAGVRMVEETSKPTGPLESETTNSQSVDDSIIVPQKKPGGPSPGA